MPIDPTKSGGPSSTDLPDLFPPTRLPTEGERVDTFLAVEPPKSVDARIIPTPLHSFAQLLNISPLSLKKILKDLGRQWDTVTVEPVPLSYGDCVIQTRFALSSLYRRKPRGALWLDFGGIGHQVALILRDSHLFVSEHEGYATQLLGLDSRQFQVIGNGHFLLPLHVWLQTVQDRTIKSFCFMGVSPRQSITIEIFSPFSREPAILSRSILFIPPFVNRIASSLEEFHASLKGAHAIGQRVIVYWGCGSTSDEVIRMAGTNPEVLIAGIDPNFQERPPGFLPSNVLFFRGTGRRALKALVGEGVIDTIRVVAPGYTDQAYERSVHSGYAVSKRDITLSEEDMRLCFRLLPEGGILEIFTENLNWSSDFKNSLERNFGPENVEAKDTDSSQAPPSQYFVKDKKVHHVRANKADRISQPRRCFIPPASFLGTGALIDGMQSIHDDVLSLPFMQKKNPFPSLTLGHEKSYNAIGRGVTTGLGNLLYEKTIGQAMGRNLSEEQVLVNTAVMMGAGFLASRIINPIGFLGFMGHSLLTLGVLHILRGEFPTSWEEVGLAMAGITIGAVAESLVEVLLASVFKVRGLTFTNVLNAPEIRGQALLGGLAYLGKGVIASFAGNIGNDAIHLAQKMVPQKSPQHHNIALYA